MGVGTAEFGRGRFLWGGDAIARDGSQQMGGMEASGRSDTGKTETNITDGELLVY